MPGRGRLLDGGALGKLTLPPPSHLIRRGFLEEVGAFPEGLKQRDLGHRQEGGELLQDWGQQERKWSWKGEPGVSPDITHSPSLALH